VSCVTKMRFLFSFTQTERPVDEIHRFALLVKAHVLEVSVPR
jgi:hypothetical protein